LAVCEQRDPKGLYRQARTGQLKNFTGIDDPYEPPEHPALTLDTTRFTPDELAGQVVDLLRSRGILPGPAS
jgi:bifunctional enzyme CysN/CysC